MEPIEGGPSGDVIALEWQEGGLSVGSANRGVWRYQNDKWSHKLEKNRSRDSLVARRPVQQARFVAPCRGGRHSSRNTARHRLHRFSHQFYHSYRGDSVDDEGFGVDIDVIRTTLDWLDAHPYVRGTGTWTMPSPPMTGWSNTPQILSPAFPNAWPTVKMKSASCRGTMVPWPPLPKKSLQSQWPGI